MHILRVAQKVYPDVKGGGPYHVHALSRDQAAMGHDVTVVTVDDDHEKPHIETRSGYTVIRYPATAAVLGNDVSAGVARYLYDADRFDVMHAHSHLYFSTNLAALKRRLGNLPLAITNHGLYSQNAPEAIFEWYLKSVGRWTFNQADVVFCYTEEDKRRIRSFGVRSDIGVVPNGIDTERFTPDGPETDLIEHDGPVILFVGRLVAGKRPQLAVKAVERLREEQPNAKLYVCGEGPIRSTLEASAGEAVELLGHVSYDEMPEVYRRADVLVLPSRAEGIPRTVLEAMASRTPVVTSDLAPMRDVVTQGGITVEEATPEAWKDALRDLLSRPSLVDALGISGYELVTTSYPWSDTVALTTKQLREISGAEN